MTLIDGDKIITAQLYDDQYEEFTEKKMSIIDYVNTYTDEGVTTDDDVLDKIRAEIMAIGNWTTKGELPNEYLVKVLEIIDKYKVEREVKE